jgi:hypothetical protein
MKFEFDITGTIGSKPCELSLGRILARQDKKVRRDVLKFLSKCRSRLLALEPLENSEAQTYFVSLLRKDLHEKFLKYVSTISAAGVEDAKDIATHTWCCITAYFREHGRKQK